MLELRPNCELCDTDLPASALNAHICSYECTFCTTCVEAVLKNVCPNCGGGFTRRPIRPKGERRKGAGLTKDPASSNRVLTRYTREEIIQFCAKHKSIPAEDR